MLDTSGKNTALIVVTGFGPFGEITTNSSSVAVEELKALWNANVELAQSSLRLSTVTQIPVTYKAVGKVVDEIWNENPTLVIHVGVDQSASAITLEQQAFNHSYSMPDACGLLCDRAGFCLSEGCDSLFCGLDLSRTVDHLNELGFKAQLSSFPGLYLCGYIYYRSLSKHHEKVAFVHVPPIGTSFSAQYLARALFEIILDLAQQRGVTVPMIQFNSEIWRSSPVRKETNRA